VNSHEGFWLPLNPNRTRGASQLKQPEVFMIRFSLIATMSIFARITTGLAGTHNGLPPDDEIRKILAERVGENEKDVGIVVGVIEPQGQRIISFGHRDAADSRPLDGDTVFEIGSVTKAFTALLLADMVAKNEVTLDNPASKYLPVDIKLPKRNGRAITLIDLATHTSGLPFMPEDAPPLNDPEAGKYSVADLKRYLAGYTLKRDIGTEWEYSNIGYWILGEALASRGQDSFENLMRTRVVGPLKMANTDFQLSPRMKANLATGHDAALQPAPSVSNLGVYSIMPAAGSLYSTVNDLSRLLSVAMNYHESRLKRAMEISLHTRRPIAAGKEQALGWIIAENGDDQVIFHEGGTYGFASSIACDPKKHVGVVVLSNQIGDVNDIARHLLRPAFPLAPTTTRHKEIKIDPALLDKYQGRYEAKGEGIFAIVREGDFLTIEFPADWGLPKLRIHPESQQDFFAAELPLRVTFKVDNNDRVGGILIYPPRGQKAVPANKLASPSR
jgi:CubicO group peptidase (beta-lactamase class C family)